MVAVADPGTVAPQLGSSSLGAAAAQAATDPNYTAQGTPYASPLAAPSATPSTSTTPPAPALVPMPYGGMGTPAQLAQYNNELAAIAGPAQAPGVDMSGYISAFNSSYDSQMANIQASLTQSMGELQNRRDIAAGIAAKFPQAVQSNYADVTNAAAPPVDMSGLSPQAQAAAAPAVAHDAGVGKANAAAAKGDAGYQAMGIASDYGSGSDALEGAANTSEASAAAQRDAETAALASQQLGYQDQYNLSRQTAQNQFAEQTIASQGAASGIPGMTVAQLDSVQNDPSYLRSVNEATTYAANPSGASKDQYQQVLNGMTAPQIQVFSAQYPQIYATLQQGVLGKIPGQIKATPGTPDFNTSNINTMATGADTIEQFMNSNFSNKPGQSWWQSYLPSNPF